MAYQRSLVLCLVAVVLFVSCAGAAEEGASYFVYIGTYTGAKSKGIYLSQLDTKGGTLTPPVLVAETTHPTFLAIHPNRKFLFAVGEMGDFAGQKTGSVSAYSIDPASGKLTLINRQPSGGRGPCHVSVDPSGTNVLVANYGGGSVSVLPVDESGKLSAPSCTIQHTGKGPNARRQEGPHAHSINLDRAGRFVFAADLGIDKILVYRLDAGKGVLTPNDPPAANLAPGAGPRHFAFHPTGKFAYAICELASTIAAFSYDADRGVLSEIQTVGTLPKDFGGTNTTAEVQVHPSGKFVYGSNRGHDSIAVFSVDERTGRLTEAGRQATQGKTPRNFGIDPTGAFLLAANQGTDNLVLFRIDPATGMLRPTGVGLEVGAPVCVKFLAVGTR